MPRLAKRFTEHQAVAEAATMAVEMMYEYIAEYLYRTMIRTGDDYNEVAYEEGRYIGALGVVNMLMGKADYVPHIPQTYVNGATLVAINIVGDGLYRTYSGGTINHYTLRPGDKALTPAAESVLKRAWIWLDPVRR